VRFLLTFAGGSGHFEPLLPIARAAREAGHVVAFSGRPAVAARTGANRRARTPHYAFAQTIDARRYASAR
jgi:UDP:flavonoid glycosyltransferase YjiC (YdhE family)